jgi:TonB family protein
MFSTLCRSVLHWPLIRAVGFSVLLHLVVLMGGGLVVVPVQFATSVPLQVALLQSDRQNMQISRLAVRQDAFSFATTKRSDDYSPAVVGKRGRQLSLPPKSLSVSPESDVGHVEQKDVADEAVSAAVLRRYRMMLSIQMRRNKSYAQQAREYRREGRAEVVLQVMPGGLLSASLVAPSGHVALDALALTMIEQSAALIPLPEEMQGRSLRLAFLLEFNFADD